MKDAYTAKEIQAATGQSLSTILRRAEREGWPFSQRPGRGGGKLFPVASLPADVREALAAGAAGQAAAGRVEGRKCAMGETMSEAAKASARQDSLSRYQRLSPEGQRRADARAALVRACRQYASTAGLSATAGRRAFAAEYNASRIEVEASIREALPSVSAGSLRNWAETLDKEGLAALAGDYGKHRKGTGTIDANQTLADFIIGMMVTYPHVSAKVVRQSIRARFDREDCPSPRALQRWIQVWKRENQGAFAKIVNPDKWRSTHLSAAGNASEDVVRLNQRWELDSTKGDVMLSDGTRHIIVGVIDVYSRRLMYLVSRSSSSAAVAALLRKAMLGWGVPEQIVTDNGSDYVSKHICRVVEDLGIKHHICAPFAPEQKPHIERSFRTFQHGAFELLTGFVGHNVTERKDIEARKSFAARLFKKGKTAEMPGLSPEKLQEFCDQWAENIYAREEHDGLGKKTPWQMAAEWPEPLRKLEGDKERALDLLLFPAAGNGGWRMVGKDGVSVDGLCYDHAQLGGRVKERVFVLTDDADAGYVYLFDEDKAFICKACCPELTGVSRYELSIAKKRVQQKDTAQKVKGLKATAKRADVGDILRAIMESAAEEAGKLTRLPAASVPYSTNALNEAGIAAKAGDAPPAVSEANAAARKAMADMEAAQAKPATVLQLPEHPRQRYRRWQELDAQIAAGMPVTEQEERWHKSYQSHPDFLSWRAVMGGAAVAAEAK